MNLRDKIKQEYDTLVAQATAIPQRAVHFNRNLTQTEQDEFDELMKQTEEVKLRMDSIVEGEQRAKQIEENWRAQEAVRCKDPGVSPLVLSHDTLDVLQGAIDARARGRFGESEELRAALAVANTGARRTWSANVLRGPRLLHMVAGVPSESTDTIKVEYLKVGALAATGAVGENVSIAEFTSVSGATGTLARFGRWTDYSRESGLSSDAAGTVTLAHRVAISKDLDLALISAVTAVAPTGAVTGVAGLRVALATVSDNVGGQTSDLTIVLHPVKAGVIEDVTPVGGATLGEAIPTFSGARIYYSSLAPTGEAVVFDGSTARYFEAEGYTVKTDENVKTAGLTIASSIIGGYGTDLLSGGSFRVSL